MQFVLSCFTVLWKVRPPVSCFIFRFCDMIRSDFYFYFAQIHVTNNFLEALELWITNWFQIHAFVWSSAFKMDQENQHSLNKKALKFSWKVFKAEKNSPSLGKRKKALRSSLVVVEPRPTQRASLMVEPRKYKTVLFLSLGYVHSSWWSSLWFLFHLILSINKTSDRLVFRST